MGAGQREGNAGRAARGFDDRLTVSQFASAPGLIEDVAGDAIFGRAAGVEELELAPDGDIIKGDGDERCGLDRSGVTRGAGSSFGRGRRGGTGALRGDLGGVTSESHGRVSGKGHLAVGVAECFGAGVGYLAPP